MLTISYLFENIEVFVELAKPELSPGEYVVPKIEKHKERKLNPRTNRVKNFKTINWLKTNVPPEERSMKNVPKYSDGKLRVRMTDWLEIKGEKRTSTSQVNTWGWSPNGKCYGWSHRAMHGFSIGEEIKPTTSGYENLKTPFKIKDRSQCEEVAKKFAESIS
jgi:hypothetical protein